MPDNKLTDVPENNVGKMSDNEIVNDVEQVTMALEYCVECDCEKCPYDELTACNEYLKLDAVKVINRLQAENKELWEERNRIYESLKEWKDIARRETSYVKTAKAEAYKECIEKVKEKANKSTWVSGGKLKVYNYTLLAENLDNLLKELVGDSK